MDRRNNLLQSVKLTASTRTYSTSNSEVKNELSALENFTFLFRDAPCFKVNGSQVQVISSPVDFYGTLKDKVSCAQKRITFASLYLGTGQLEQELVDCVHERVQSNSQLKVNILLDYSRGSRGKINSRTMLLPLLASSKDTARVALYHTPVLRGFLKWLMPERYNETIGLQHMKIYLVDDTVIISGANLSHDYFTNRQDRYIMIRDCPLLADFYNQLVDTVSEFSFQLNSGDELTLHPNWPIHPYKHSKALFVQRAHQKIKSSYDSYKKNVRETFETSEAGDTWMFPLLQMGQLGIYVDSQVTKALLQSAPYGSHIKLASGYFNLTQDYMDTILGSEATFDILMAHPTANGFLGAKGFAGAIPAAYTQLAFEFFQRLRYLLVSHRIKLMEYRRNMWTFHAKGLWLYLNSGLPILTLIGSPNFGYRSVYRDLESQLAIVTLNPSLRSQLHNEQVDLWSRSEGVIAETFLQTDRVVPLWVKIVIRVIKKFF
nr:EOG090X08SX [Triops cancriformis]